METEQAAAPAPIDYAAANGQREGFALLQRIEEMCNLILFTMLNENVPPELRAVCHDKLSRAVRILGNNL